MKTLAVHLHLHYMEQLDEVLSKISNLRGIDYDLFVTMTQKNPEVYAKIKAFNPQAQIWEVENRGYDIGPFVEFLHRIDLDNYEYVLKLHTKNKRSQNYTHLNNVRFDNALWGKVLWDALLSSEKRVQKNLALLHNPQVGMLSSSYCINNEECNYKKLLDSINQQLKKMDLPKAEKPEFVAGSMFYVKSGLLKPLLKLQMSDFALTDGTVKEGTLAHVVERIMGIAVEKQGYKIAGIGDWYPRFVSMKIALERFVYQRKITASNKLLIKVFKLPIYSKKL